MNVLQFVIVAVVVMAMWIQYQLKQLGVKPIANKLPDLPVFPSGKDTIKNITGLVELVGRGELVGPEALITGGNYLFATLGNGRIARLRHGDDKTPIWEFIAQTGGGAAKDCSFSPSDLAGSEVRCGRPLGIKIVKRSTVDPNFNLAVADEDGNNNDEDVFLVADGYRGLLMITNIYAPAGQSKVTTLATRANSDPPTYHFHLLNALVQAPDGSIYISETTQRHHRRRIFFAALEGQASGRLLRYTKLGGVEVVATGISMANGVALSHDQQSILVVSGVQILQYSLQTNTLFKEPFVHVLPGTGDNIDVMNHLPSGEARNCYWAGLGSKFAQPFSLLKLASNKVWLKSILVALVPYHIIVDLIPKLSALAVFDEHGELIQVYRDDSFVFPWLSEGELFDGYLYLGSWYNPSLARIKQSDLS